MVVVVVVLPDRVVPKDESETSYPAPGRRLVAALLGANRVASGDDDKVGEVWAAAVTLCAVFNGNTVCQELAVGIPVGRGRGEGTTAVHFLQKSPTHMHTGMGTTQRQNSIVFCLSRLSCLFVLQALCPFSTFSWKSLEIVPLRRNFWRS